jgi:hypothetical protein
LNARHDLCGGCLGVFLTPLGRDNTQKHASKKHKGGMKRVGVLFGISTAKRRLSLRRHQTCTWPVQKTSKCGQDQFCDMPDADPTLPTHPTTNRPAINYQVFRGGTKTVARGRPQQHSKQVGPFEQWKWLNFPGIKNFGRFKCSKKSRFLSNHVVVDDSSRWTSDWTTQCGCVVYWPRPGRCLYIFSWRFFGGAFWFLGSTASPNLRGHLLQSAA